MNPHPPEPGAAAHTRYARQMRCPQIGPDGQAKLAAASVVLVGCGALGSVAAEHLVRAGVGRIRLIDRDFVEWSNLQRQSLFDEQDARECQPKAEAAARRLRRINSSIEIDARVADLHAANVETLAADADVILDGTDNVETRYLLNDLAVSCGRPWIYAGCVGAEGRVLAVVPSRTRCLRCLWETPPPPGSLPTCDTAGVLGPAVGVVASLQVLEAIKVLRGRVDKLLGLVSIDAWSARVSRVAAFGVDSPNDCPCCGRRRFEFLHGERGSHTSVLCGRGAVQVTPMAPTRVDLDAVALRLPAGAGATRNAFLLRFNCDGRTITLFHDGRAIVQGVDDAAEARSVLARWVGS